MTPIQMGRDPIKIRSRWCLLTGGQLNNFKKVRAHTESNFNIVFIKQTSTGFKDTHNTASRSVVRTLVTLMSWAHVQHIQTPLFFYSFSHYIYCFLSPHPAHITSCTHHILLEKCSSGFCYLHVKCLQTTSARRVNDAPVALIVTFPFSHSMPYIAHVINLKISRTREFLTWEGANVAGDIHVCFFVRLNIYKSKNTGITLYTSHCRSESGE